MLTDRLAVVGSAGTTDFSEAMPYDLSKPQQLWGIETESRESVEHTAKTEQLLAFNQRVAALQRFVRFDTIGSVAGVLVLLVAVPLIDGATPVLALLGPLLLLLAALVRSKKLLSSTSQLPVEQVEKALFLVTAGNWLIAISVTWLVPFLWPIMVLTVVMTIVLVTPHLSKTTLLAFMVLAALLGATVGVLGLLRDDEGIIEDIDDTLEFLVVTGALVAQIIPIGLLSWQTNNIYRQAFVEQVALNDTLQESEENLAEERRKLIESRRRVVAASTAERSRIERDLHDGAQQRLAAIGVRLRLLRSTTDSGSPMPAAALDDVVSDLDAAIDELRELAHGIYPPLLEQNGLPAVLQAVARRSPTEVVLDVEQIGRHGRAIESTLYFSCLEALANVHKHAPGASVEVALRYRRRASTLELSVTDDGPGFEQAGFTGGRGMDNMTDRLAAVGGSLEVLSAPGKGTRVVASVPTDSRN